MIQSQSYQINDLIKHKQAKLHDRKNGGVNNVGQFPNSSKAQSQYLDQIDLIKKLNFTSDSDVEDLKKQY